MAPGSHLPNRTAPCFPLGIPPCHQAPPALLRQGRCASPGKERDALLCTAGKEAAGWMERPELPKQEDQFKVHPEWELHHPSLFVAHCVKSQPAGGGEAASLPSVVRKVKGMTRRVLPRDPRPLGERQTFPAWDLKLAWPLPHQPQALDLKRFHHHRTSSLRVNYKVFSFQLLKHIL